MVDGRRDIRLIKTRLTNLQISTFGVEGEGLANTNSSGEIFVKWK